MLKRFCCMRLKTAGIVISWLGIVGSILTVIVVGGLLGYSDGIRRHIVHNSSANLERNEQIYDAVHDLIVVNGSMLLGVAVLQLSASGMLLLGIMKNWHLMLLPWLINTGINIAVMVLNTFFLILAFCGTVFDIFMIALLLIETLMLTALIYCFCAIYALYKEIQSSKNQRDLPLMQTEVVGVPHQTTTYPNYAKI